MHLLMTGATGLLGRNFLFESIYRHRDHLSALQLTVLGAGRRGVSLRQRLIRMLRDDGVAYLAGSGIDPAALDDWLANQLSAIECRLDAPGLGISAVDRERLRCPRFDAVVHIAANTDFRDGAAVEAALHQVNYVGTEALLTLSAEWQVDQWVYVGTAYSCGMRSGRVAPDQIDFEAGFRNPYERIKLETECRVRAHAIRHGLRLRVFRPSTIAGRLMHPVAGSVSKFDVFYAYGAFLTRLRDRFGTAGRQLPLRLRIDPEHGLNIVPADYAAKVMHTVIDSACTDDSFHLANAEETPNHLYMGLIESSVGVAGRVFVDHMPEQPNRAEQLLYKTLYRILAPYCNAPPTCFDTANLAPLLADAGLRCPPVNEGGINTLIAYAATRRFGLPAVNVAA